MNRSFHLYKSSARRLGYLLTHYRGPIRSLATSPRSVTQITKRVSTMAVTVLLTTGAAAGFIYYLEKTSRLQLIEYARTHKSTTLQDSSWRSCLAVALIDMYRQKSGPQILRRLHCGIYLGRYIANPKTYMTMGVCDA